MTNDNVLSEIKTVLADLPKNRNFVIGAHRLLETLGYRSDRTLDLSGDVDEFIEYFGARNKGNKSEERFRENAGSVRIVFQITNTEIGELVNGQHRMFTDHNFDKGEYKSFVFAAVELKCKSYPRGRYAEFTREVNKRFSQPTVVLFRTADDLLTLAFVHRRQHKRDPDRKVLGSVSLIREINTVSPHRAHLDILSKLALPERLNWMKDQRKLYDFDGLLAAWLDALDTEELNRRFYKELFDWFTRARSEAEFPTDQAKILPEEEHVIRLITRLLFVWFIKEKKLIAPQLFKEKQIGPLLRDYDRDTGDSYYRVVLQNLFFATLNSEIPERGFSKESNTTHRDFSRYRYKTEIADPDRLLELFGQTPFINGGLFDCLDSFEAPRDGGYRIDCFTDNVIDPTRKEFGILSIPNRLFFDDKGLISLFDRFQFTVEENTPAEQEVALDPELLGKVFENLLAAYNPETRETARRQTGSYYTPRAVVDYMVDEALVASLALKCAPTDGDTNFWKERLRYLLDYEDAFDDAHELFEESEREGLMRAISGLKLIDPAVGSGAFPMGALHKLTLALRRLDPQNTLWESLQKELAGQRAAAAFDTEDQAERDAELEEISATFEQYRDSDFGRKLYLIQNSIYGVDIQPVACQISKLRFFISLAIEQEPSSEVDDNYGIRPLPNLETRFVAANTLIGLDNQTQMLLGQNNPSVDELQRELNANRERHFHATTRQKKSKCRKSDQQLRDQLAAALEQSGLLTDAAKKIALWDSFDQNSSADWFDFQYMFGVKDGFDVIIGNPPYVESRNSLLSADLKDAYISQVHSDWQVKLPRGSDLLIYFYARAPKFLNGLGRGCFITQNAWLSTNYGKAFQDFTQGKFSFERIVDSSAKFFSDTESQNINAIITFFSTRKVAEIEYAIADSDMVTVPERTIAAKQSMKWGHLFSMPEFYGGILEKMSARANAKGVITFGQGLNFPMSKLDLPESNIPVIVKSVSFVADSADRKVGQAEISVARSRKVPALVMPRGIGERYYCTFNISRAYSYSHVEAYLPKQLWETELHYCLWAYLNSSLVWLFREITGRKNLGGGMLKAEATDMKTLPVNFNFDFADDAKHVFDLIKTREPLPVSEEVYTKEHLILDDMIGSYFGISSQNEAIRRALLDQVGFRLSKARPK